MYEESGNRQTSGSLATALGANIGNGAADARPKFQLAQGTRPPPFINILLTCQEFFIIFEMMNAIDFDDLGAVLHRIRDQVNNEDIRITIHAQQEMVEEGIALDDVLEAIANGKVLENYPQHRRGACCLLYGVTQSSRPLHIVCTTSQPLLILITVYEPKPPKWITPVRRRQTR